MLLTSCGGGHSSNDSGSSTSTQTIKWQLDNEGFVQLFTNDPQYYGYSFWNTYTQTNQSPMATVTATVKKMSGSLSSGYGVIFCYQDNNNFYRLLITTGGYYCVYEKVGGTYNTIIPWTSIPSPHLNNGVGVENVISVAQPTLNNFSIYFNGSFETSFSDSNFSGGKSGFTMSVSPTTENFPYTPEDVRFKMSSPVTYP